MKKYITTKHKGSAAFEYLMSALLFGTVLLGCVAALSPTISSSYDNMRNFIANNNM
jgi:hypothetical protein